MCDDNTASNLREKAAELLRQAEYHEWEGRIDIRLTRALHDILCSSRSHEPGECSFDYDTHQKCRQSLRRKSYSAYSLWHPLAILVLDIASGKIERMLRDGNVNDVLGMLHSLPMSMRRIDTTELVEQDTREAK